MSEFSDIEIVDDSGPLLDPSEYLADVPTKLISGVLGLMGFTTASIVGLLAGNPGIVILGRALVAMLICSFVGRLLGGVGEVCVREFVEHYKSGRPTPEMPEELVRLQEEQKAHESVVKNMKKAA
ncbi:MAG: hypothetical protein ACWA5W_03165 [Phycisphaerales bacterium]